MKSILFGVAVAFGSLSFGSVALADTAPKGPATQPGTTRVQSKPGRETTSQKSTNKSAKPHHSTANKDRSKFGSHTTGDKRQTKVTKQAAGKKSEKIAGNGKDHSVDKHSAKRPAKDAHASKEKKTTSHKKPPSHSKLVTPEDLLAHTEGRPNKMTIRAERAEMSGAAAKQVSQTHGHSAGNR